MRLLLLATPAHTHAPAFAAQTPAHLLGAIPSLRPLAGLALGSLFLPSARCPPRDALPFMPHPASAGSDAPASPPARCSRLPEPIPFPQLVCEVVKQLEGAYALLIKSSVYPGELVACRRGSPLILGMKYGIQVRLGLVQGTAGGC